MLDEFLSGRNVQDIQRDDLRAFVRMMSQRGYKPVTIRRAMHGMGTFWHWLILANMVDRNLAREVDLPRRSRNFPRWMSRADFNAYIAAANRPDVALHEATAWLMLAYTGIRPSEMLNLLVRNVRLSDTPQIMVMNTKSKEDRIIPLHPDLLPDLGALINGRQPDDYLFGVEDRRWRRQNAYRAFAEHLDRAGLSERGYTMYSVRHSFATHLALRGVPINVIRALLGHKDIQTTGKYLHVAATDLAAAIAGMG
jgi:site-specific recombinase XerD